MRLISVRCLQAAAPALLGAVAAALCTTAVAQMRMDAVPQSVLRPYSARDLGAVPPDAAARSAYMPPAAALRSRDYSWLGGALQVESARETPDGRYTRPKVIIGLPSESMKGWMNSAGFSTEQCLLPMLRARARLSADGEASGAMWLYARCTFQ
jgi:hypothetical protein